jgi:hypothetical protein
MVCGAGAAGCAAALAAARAGARVHLIEIGDQPGGTVANCLIHTLGGLYDADGRFLHDGLVGDFVRTLSDDAPSVRLRRLGRTWVLNVCPDHYRATLQRCLAAEARLTLRHGARITRLVMRGATIAAAHVVQHGDEQRVPVSAIIDATGTAETVRLLDPGLLQDADPTAAGGIILRLRGVAPGALAFPAGAGFVHSLRAAAQRGDLPAECGKAWLDSGVHEDEVYLKLFVPLPRDWRLRCEAVAQTAREHGTAVVAFLKKNPPFAGAWIERIGQLGIREGGRIRGEYCLTRDDVLQGRSFADAACRCAWPIEFWDPERGVSLEYLPASQYYEIPLRALKVQGVDNLWAVGKCLSADAHAQASARIVGCCWAMGQAVGRAVLGGTTPWG